MVSDWLDMEKARGISITSAALQFVYRDHVVNLLDTPGHADFSEDTYRVLTAVDSAVMLVDAAKGMERQTMKLFDVCKLRGLPVLTVINKWDRPGLEALELMDEIAEKTGMTPTPVLWPVGIGGDFRGLLDLRDDTYIAFDAGTGGATRTTSGPGWTWTRAWRARATCCTTAVEEAELITDANGRHDEAGFRAGRTSPVVFAAAVLNRGVEQLLDILVETAPPPGDRPTVDDGVVPRTSATRSAARCSRCRPGWTPHHRDHVAFIRVASGRFQRGQNVINARTGKVGRHQVRPPGVRRDAHRGRGRVARRRGRHRQRQRGPGRRHPVRGPLGQLPAHPDVRPGALRGVPGGRPRQVQAVPARHHRAAPRGRRADPPLGHAR